MKKPTRILQANGIGQRDLAKFAKQTVQYVSMQLNGHRPLTAELERAIRELLPETIASEVIRKRGEE